jgi:hypothetical protein
VNEPSTKVKLKQISLKTVKLNTIGMKADVPYNDFIGTVAADISDDLANQENLQDIAGYFKLDISRFKLVGLSIYGPGDFMLSLICVDLTKSSNEQEFIIKMSYDIHDQQDIISILFKSLHIILHDKFDRKYTGLDYAEEIRYSDYH